MTNEDLCYQTVGELSALIASRQVSPVELTRAYLERTEALNPTVSVVITLTRDHALRQAAAAEREIQLGRRRGPLHGIPYAVKDLYDTQGIRTTGGSTIYRDRVPDRDATAIERLNEAGAVLLAKLAMSEFASGGNNNNLIPHPRNPWKLDRSPAGSSSGSGAATAAALAGFTLGSETGGSIMGPSGANGVSGMRPTYGRVSRYGVMALAWSLDKAGPLARSAADLGLVLEVIAGHDPRDRTSRPNAAFTFRSDPGPVASRRLGVVRAEFEAVPEANRAVFANALAVLRRAGFVLEDVVLPDRPYGEVYTLISNTEAGTNFKPLFNDGRIIQFSSASRRADWMAASMMPASDYLTALRIRALLKREADEVTARYAALIAPTSPTGSGPIEPPDTPPRAGDLSDRSVRRLNTLGNLTGLPAISIPCGFDGEGMPLGLHIAARAWDDQSVLDVGMVFQRETDFHRRRPSFRP
ncbi:MAG: amidase [Gemmatimonadetes bacterium]|nr:amidase [Gemmatimonadota bacterium]